MSPTVNQQISTIGQRTAPLARPRRLWLAALLCFGAAQQSQRQAQASPSFAAVVRGVQPKIVKIYGAGGFRGLEPYQSGFLISPEGHVLTVWSYVLDTEFITVTLDDGRKFEAKLLGADPRLELALLKIEAADLPYFDLAQEIGRAHV